MLANSDLYRSLCQYEPVTIANAGLYWPMLVYIGKCWSILAKVLVNISKCWSKLLATVAIRRMSISDRHLASTSTCLYTAGVVLLDCTRCLHTKDTHIRLNIHTYYKLYANKYKYKSIRGQWLCIYWNDNLLGVI